MLTNSASGDFDLSTLDLDSLERVDRSYLLLPPHTRGHRCSGRDALCRSVLNDSLMIYPPASVQRYDASDPNRFAKVCCVAEEDQYPTNLNFDSAAILFLNKTDLNWTC